MKVKHLDREETLKLIEIFRKRIDFNNTLNAYVRKFMKARGLDTYSAFNGYHDEPTEEMKQEMIAILTQDKLGDVSWMSQQLKKEYASSCAEIFGQVYSPAVNRYVLSDLHDLEKHLKELEQASQNRNEENSMFKVERDLNSNRLNLYFEDIPEYEVRTLLKRNGFKWSSYLGAWTRQLTQNAEISLEKLKKDLDI